MADELGLRFLETSAKSNINVEEAFFALATCVPFFLTPSLSRVTTREYGGLPVQDTHALAGPLLCRDIKNRLAETNATSGGATGAAGSQGGNSLGLGGSGNAENKSGCC